jgi:hypothetical protein
MSHYLFPKVGKMCTNALVVQHGQEACGCHWWPLTSFHVMFLHSLYNTRRCQYEFSIRCYNLLLQSYKLYTWLKSNTSLFNQQLHYNYGLACQLGDIPYQLQIHCEKFVKELEMRNIPYYLKAMHQLRSSYPYISLFKQKVPLHMSVEKLNYWYLGNEGAK